MTATMQAADTFPPRTGAGRPLRVLIVEDESLLSLDLEMMLDDWGHIVVGSEATGANGVREALEQQPDVVLMDINLGAGIDGVAAATAIREKLDTRFVFMTAYTDRDIAARLEGFGATVLHKPLDPDRLRQVLSEAADGRTG